MYTIEKQDENTILNNMLVKDSDINISFEEDIIRISYVDNGMNKGLLIKKELTEDSIKALLLFGSGLYIDGVINECRE